MDSIKGLTRRRFTAMTTTAVALTVLGCGRTDEVPSLEATAAAGSPPGTPGTPGNPSTATPAGSPPAATSSVATSDDLAPLATGDPAEAEGQSKRANLATGPFTIGPAARYIRPGVYATHKKSHGVWIVSDGATLVVFSATCTHLRCTTHYDGEARCFFCPCHESRFDTTGVQFEDAEAKRPLERCALSLVTDESGVVVQVDPTTRFRKERHEWDNPASMLKLS